MQTEKHCTIKYGNYNKNVTDQSEQGKYALRDFLKARTGFDYYVCNFIWLTNVSSDSLKNLLGENAIISHTHNVLNKAFKLLKCFN